MSCHECCEVRRARRTCRLTITSAAGRCAFVEVGEAHPCLPALWRTSAMSARWRRWCFTPNSIAASLVVPLPPADDGEPQVAIALWLGGGWGGTDDVPPAIGILINAVARSPAAVSMGYFTPRPCSISSGYGPNTVQWTPW